MKVGLNFIKNVNEASMILKIKFSENDWSPSIKLGFSFNIPSDYITNLDRRYRKISNITENSDLTEILMI